MLERNIILVTGANTGIGYETVKALYASTEAHTILMGSRSLDKAHAAISTLKHEIPGSKSEIVPLQIDIKDNTSIDNAFKEVKSKYAKVDTLVNNAGQQRFTPLDKANNIDRSAGGSFDGVIFHTPGAKGIREAFNHTHSPNVTSTEVCTHTFAPLHLKSPHPRLLFITSGLSSLTNSAAGTQSRVPTGTVPAGCPKPKVPSTAAYHSSKTALNMMMLEWRTLLKEDGVKVFCISPGFLATGLGGFGKEALERLGAGHASVGGGFIKDVVEGTRDGDFGMVLSTTGIQPW